jgi:hypothetical protein
MIFGVEDMVDALLEEGGGQSVGSAEPGKITTQRQRMARRDPNSQLSVLRPDRKYMRVFLYALRNKQATEPSSKG